jgi:hypothetical protein
MFLGIRDKRICRKRKLEIVPSCDGAGTFCWPAGSLGSYINSWNTSNVTINGVNISNLYVASSSYPAKINRFYYISYTNTGAFGHFETK